MAEAKKIEGFGALPQNNLFDNIPDFTGVVHRRENNSSSEKHLNDNRRKFTGDCAIVLSLLHKGMKLTTYSALVQWQVSSLPRRILDLKEAGIDIEDDWQMSPDKKVTRNKVWFLPANRKSFFEKGWIANEIKKVK